MARKPRTHNPQLRHVSPRPGIDLSARYLSIRQPALQENIRRFRVIHESAIRQAERS